MELEDAGARPEGARISANILARPVLRHVKVLAVDQTFGANLEGAILSQTVTLEVTPDDALVLGAASQRAALGLALISRDEEAMVAAITPEKVADVKPVVQPRSRPVLRRDRFGKAKRQPFGEGGPLSGHMSISRFGPDTVKTGTDAAT
jgi:Flp pilus assembly protein CpaB